MMACIHYTEYHFNLKKILSKIHKAASHELEDADEK